MNTGLSDMMMERRETYAKIMGVPLLMRDLTAPAHLSFLRLPSTLTVGTKGA